MNRSGYAGVSNHVSISAEEIILFGECGLIVPAVRRRLLAAISLANSRAWFSVVNVSVARAYRRDLRSDFTEYETYQEFGSGIGPSPKAVSVPQRRRQTLGFVV